MKNTNPYILCFLIYICAIVLMLFPAFSRAQGYEVNGIWDHPTKKGKWIVEIENSGKIIKFEIDDLSDKSDGERKQIIEWMVNKSIQKMGQK